MYFNVVVESKKMVWKVSSQTDIREFYLFSFSVYSLGEWS